MSDFKKRYGKIYSEVYTLQERYFSMDDRDEVWDQLRSDGDQIYKRYKGTAYELFVKNILIAVLGEIERATLERKTERK